MSTRNDAPLAVAGQSKISASHLRRLACIYVRQSTLKQVEHHRESQINQYDLATRAAALGWPAAQIRVIDADLGLSGQGSAYRAGFTALVAELSLGHVGIIFGYEVSRLARNNSDWYHVLDLAAVFDTLIADNDGIYDPRQYNDRLLLGLKGTMSEAELHLLHQRMEAGRLSQVRRGAYRQRLPTGLVRVPDGTVALDPDDQVRQTLALVFAEFERLGSCHQVLRVLQRDGVLLPRRQVAGRSRDQLRWLPPSAGAIYAILRNPAYAGAFAYGRRQSDPTRRDPTRPGTGHRHMPATAWIALQQDAYPAYITWEQYLANQARLQQNAARYQASPPSGPGVARDGMALLQGLVICGRCGQHMQVAYKGRHRYHCTGLNHDYGGTTCPSFEGHALDMAVTEAFFAAIEPAQLDALEAVLADQHQERARLEQHWQARRQRSAYAVELVQRQYDAVDPANRLVAAELERRWEEQLRQRAETEAGYTRFQQQQAAETLSPEQRQELEHLAETLPQLWAEGEIPHAQQKELLRSLIQRVVVKRLAPDQVEATIVWVSGHYSVVLVPTTVQRTCDLASYGTLLARVEQLWKDGRTDSEIAAQVKAEGLRTARRMTVSPDAVKRLRLEHGWQTPRAQSWHADMLDGYLTSAGVAARLGVPRRWVYQQIMGGQIAAEYLTRHAQSHVYLIRDDPTLLTKLRQVLARNAG